MQNISEFEKLFKFNFPVKEYFQYYVDTLMESPFYSELGNLIKEFEQYETDVGVLYGGVKSYKLDHALPKIKDYLIKTSAYEKLINVNLNNYKFRSKDELRNNDNEYLISIDFKSANYSALKTFDDDNELFGSWEELCLNLNIHPTLIKSKSFRQYVFGNTAPKRFQIIQHAKITKIVDKLIEDYGFLDSDFVFISHDEFIVKLKPEHKLAISRINVLLSAVENIVKTEKINMQTHCKVFKNDGIGAGMCVQTEYQVKMGGLSEKYTTLFKVPANKYFKYFKTHILKKPIDKRDLMFISDGDLCCWRLSEDSIGEIIIPDDELTINEIEKYYPHLIEKIREDVSGLNESQIRKTINIFLSFVEKMQNEKRD